MNLENNKAGRDNIPNFPISPPTGVNWLLAIAIDDYQPPVDKLNNCVRDVKAFIEVVTRLYDFESEYIIPIFNADATTEGIESAFRKLLKNVKSQDNLIIYYSGHGDYDEELDLGYWIPVDATNGRQGLNNDMIIRYLNKIPSRHTLLLCDSCFSGSLLIEGNLTRSMGQRYNQPSRWAITSGGIELVADGKGYPHSPFCRVLLRVLKESKSDVNVIALGTAIMEEVAANEKQKPLFAPMRVDGHKGGMFVFVKKKDEIPYQETAQQTKILKEESEWKKAAERNGISDYKEYLDNYPNSTHTAEARHRIDAEKKIISEDILWKATDRLNTLQAYEEYLNQYYPYGKYVKQAQQKIADLEAMQKKEKQDKEPEMIFVQGGTFRMGSNRWFAFDEKPIREVVISDFYIGKYPVTFAEYDAYCEATNIKKPNDEEWGRDKRPVINVDWNDANAYCKWLSEKTGKKYRLPTEAEWEYAARGGNQSKGFKYSGSDDLNKVGWYNENAEGKTQPVGEKNSNELKIHDMSGNVWEWCKDHWHDDYEGAPKDGSAWMLDFISARSDFMYYLGIDMLDHVVRGGSWKEDSKLCRVAHRNKELSYIGKYFTGFRIAQNK